MKRFLMQMTIAFVLLSARMDATEVHYGLVGITPIDTARLSAFCSEDGTPITPPEACAVEFHFHDMSGRIVKQSAATLAPGATGFLDIRSPEAGAAAGGRVGIVPCVRVGSGRAFGSLRIFDNFSLRQRVFANGADPIQARGGEVHFGVVGITGAETSRLNALCMDELGCEVTFIFHVSGGRILKQATITLGPGASGFLDLRASEAGLTARSGEIVPCVRVGRGIAISNFEMIDTVTGLTTQVAYPATAILSEPR